MTVNNRKRTLAVKRKQAAHHKKQKQKKRMLITASALALLTLCASVLLIVLLPGKSQPSDLTFDSPTPSKSTSPLPTVEPTPQFNSGVNINMDSPAFTSALPIYKCLNLSDKKIAITVDDCNDGKIVQKIIDYANGYNAKLTLFPIGKKLVNDSLKQALKSAYYSGFEIENHTMYHLYQETLTDEEFFNEILSQELAVSEALGIDYKMNFFRLPGGNGEEDPRVHYYLKTLNYKAIADWHYSGTDASVTAIRKHLKPGAIYLFHATNEDYQKLKEFIPAAISEGYQLVTLNELAGYPANTVHDYGTLEIPSFSQYVYSEYIVMEKGMRATCIKHLQSRLIELHYLPADSIADGIFGSQTEEAVIRFQSMHGLEATGKADLETQAILFSSDAQNASF